MSSIGICPFCKHEVLSTETRCSSCGFQVRHEPEEKKTKKKREPWTLSIRFFSLLSIFGAGVLLYNIIVSKLSSSIEAIGLFSLIVGLLGLLISQLNKHFG